MRYLWLSFPLFVLACGEEEKDTDVIDTDVVETEVDNDGDGFTPDVDCDDDNADINPEATETCDTIDNDCDGLVDDEDDSIDLSTGSVFYADTDADGFGDANSEITACQLPEEGAVDNMDDCDDTNAAIHPEANEVCDGLDNNCNNLIDDEDDTLDLASIEVVYVDMDADGYGDANGALTACELPFGEYANNGDDCDDNDANTFPNAPEICDGIPNSCGTELGTEETDNDGDGYVECSIVETGWMGDTAIIGGDDCDDSNVDFHAVQNWYFDDDGDGFGDDSTLFLTCVPPPNGYVLQGMDCDDSNADTYPGAMEICDGVFNDCTDISYSATGAPADETDNDGDGYVECSIDSSGWSGSSLVTGGDDCNDSNILHHQVQDWFLDVDGDGFGNPNTVLNICTPPSSSYTTDSTDCNDSNADTYPGAMEICDGLSNDCDNTNGLSSDEIDDDGDGFVECMIAFTGWNGVGNVVGGNDCDDDQADMYPLNIEVCDGLDNDCDGDLDDDDASWNRSTGIVSYTDADGDGEGDASSMIESCLQPSGTVLNDTDCDDGDASRNNSDLDQDGLSSCGEDTTGDGSIDTIDCDDTNGMVGATDNDGDGFVACIDDCDDNDASINPIDNDGDGLSTCDGDCDDSNSSVGIEDNDGDGFSACINDCDDNNANTYPGAAYNESDPTLCLEDADGDGYGDYMGFNTVTCIDFELYDSYGDGWNGNEIDVYEDGALTGTYANENLDGVNNNTATGGETTTDQHCIDSSTALVELVFIDGQYNTEVEFTLYNASDDSVLGFGEGAGTTDLIWEGTTFIDGETFFSFDPNALPVMTGGTDCDDTDGTYHGDDDGDGHAACLDDCDDTDASLNPSIDDDGDGFSICNDCDDTDATVNPEATETWYDGVDQDCDGANDFDQDDDGFEVDFYTDANGVLISHGGLDCNDQSNNYLPLSNEANPNACYYDSDGDGFGDDTLSTTAISFGAVEGTDCYDFSATIYPGAAYNEPDVDGDGLDDCTQDTDGDGYGNSIPSSWYNALAGTDCDDTDAFTYVGASYMEPDVDGDGLDDCTQDTDGDGYGNQEPTNGALAGTDCNDDDQTMMPTVDQDGDGIDACNDCDDSNPSLVGGFLYLDADGDGYGDQVDMGLLTCNTSTLDLDGDGVDEYSLLNTDCDDNSALISPLDNDGDGFGACENADGLSDCDDTDPNTFPGAGYNESYFNPNDLSTYLCQTDGDGDGYVVYEPIGCFDFTMVDSYGDSWNGNAIEVYEDGALTGTYANENLDGVNNNTSGGETTTDQHCALGNTYELTMVYIDGNYNSEVSFNIQDDSGTVILEGEGSGTSTLTVNGVDYTDGDTIYTVTGSTGSDVNDNDPTVH